LSRWALNVVTCTFLTGRKREFRDRHTEGDTDPQDRRQCEDRVQRDAVISPGMLTASEVVRSRWYVAL
jgi:hypothetical protein